ncbi:MAG: hypothetical protein ABEJ62_02460 [Candidatus Nanohaloarchaea archaeon]
MGFQRVLNTAELILGAIVLSAGLATAAISAYRENFPGVFLGFLVFVVGYKVSQYGVRISENSGIRDTVSDMVEGARFIDLLMAVTGIGSIAYGFTTLFQSLQNASLLQAFLASTLMFAGYVLTHYAVNRTLV